MKKEDLIEMDDEEIKRVEEVAELEEAKSRLIFDGATKKVDFQNHRCTDAKHNTRVILPGPLSPKEEGELEMRRIEWSSIFDKYLEEFCDEEGIQESNLTKEEQAGLKSLQKRMEVW